MSNKESVTNKAGDCPNDQRDQRSQPSTAENLALGQLPCSLLVECTEDEQTFTARLPHNRLRVWKGRDVWHQDVHVQVRLEPDGRIYLSTQEGHVSTLRSATITIEDFYTLIRGVTANDLAHPRADEAVAEQESRPNDATRSNENPAPGALGAAPCSPSSVELLSFIDFITPKFASAMGMPQYKDAAMDELLQWLLEWRSQSHQWSDELLGRVSQGQIETRRYNGP